MIVRPDLSQFDSTSEVQQILQEIKSEGPRAAISSNWERIKELHEKEAFSIQEIVWLFDRCRSVTALRTASLNARVLGNPDEASIPLGTLIVQLFTNFVCHQIPSLEPSEITCFIEALTSPALPMDEFWLFMMAKQIQDASDRFSPSQIVTIARCYAWKNLEDEEFFDALCSSVHRRLAEFTLPQLAQFLFSCARVRFLHQELCADAFPLFQDHASVSALDGAALGAVITAAGMLDWRSFDSVSCCRLLASRPWKDLHAAQGASDLAMGLALATVMQTSSGSRLLLLTLLESFSSLPVKANWSRKEVAMLQRRVILTGLCAAFGVPKREAWDLAQLRIVQATFDKLQSYLDRTGTRTNSWEPESSRFHLEVVAILNLLEVQHHLEYPQMPFQLDVMITPEQLNAANLEIDANEPSEASESSALRSTRPLR